MHSRFLLALFFIFTFAGCVKSSAIFNILRRLGQTTEINEACFGATLESKVTEPYGCTLDVVLYKNFASCEVSQVVTLSRSCANGQPVQDGFKRVLDTISGKFNGDQNAYAIAQETDENVKYFFSKNTRNPHTGKLEFDESNRTTMKRCFDVGKGKFYFPFNYDFNCHGHSMSFILGKRFAVIDKFPILNSYCRPLNAGEAVKIGDLADFGGHTGIVSMLAAHGDNHFVYGRDGYMGVYEGTRDEWVRGWGWKGYWRCVTADEKSALCKKGDGAIFSQSNLFP